MAKQHVQMFRKERLRRELLKYAVPGCAYVPFCGDGDLSGALYTKPPITKVFAADLNPERVATCQERYPDFQVVTANCDTWPFPGLQTPPFSVGDFDAYSHPYPSFKAFFAEAKLADRLVLFFTDAHRMGIIRGKMLIDPESVHIPIESLSERRRLFNFYLKLVVYPWFEKVTVGWKILAHKKYLRGKGIVYWGVVISRNQGASS